MSESSSSPQRIWVVDDDRAVRFVLCTALREAGYQVVDFDSAAPALQALSEGPPPALLFTDVRMPGDDGLVLLDKLKAALPQLPVVVMSAYTDVASTAGAFRGGAHEFLSSRSIWTMRWHWRNGCCRPSHRHWRRPHLRPKRIATNRRNWWAIPRRCARCSAPSVAWRRHRWRC